MPTYRYKALDDEGRPASGELDASTSYELARILKSQGFSLTYSTPLEREGTLLAGFRQLTWEDLRLFSQQLASITRSGYPLAPALRTMAEDLHRPRLRGTLERLQDDVERGGSLSEAIERQQDRFPRLYGALIRAGETTGDLSGVLALMSGHAAKMSAVRHRFMLAMMYPVVLLFSTAWVLGYILLFTVPTYIEVYGELAAEMPAPTRLLVFLSETLRGYWPVLSVALPVLLAGVVLGYGALRRTEGGRYLTDGLKMYFPGVGACYYTAVQARFCHTLGLLLAARVSLVNALELAGAASGSAVLERRSLRAADEVDAGERLTDSLRRTGFFGHNFIWLLGTGEDRGCAEEALQNMADSFDRETRARERTLGLFTAPLLTAVIGVIIGFVVIAMYLPIFALGDQMGGV